MNTKISKRASSKKNWSKKYDGSILYWTVVILVVILIIRPILFALVVQNNKAADALIFPTDAPFKISMSLIAVITFFGFVWMGFKSGGALALHKGGMRLAITAAVIVVDLVILTSMVFGTNTVTTKTVTVDGVKTSEEVITNEAVPTELATSLMKNFNTVVGVIIAFYFGSSAYVEVKGKDTEESDAEDQDTENEDTENKDKGNDT